MQPPYTAPATEEAAKPGDCCSDHDQRHSDPNPPSPRTPASLLDQSLEIVNAPLEVAVLLGLGLAGR